MSTEMDGYRLECTCDQYPEQYDVFKGDVQVAYFRVRHGTFWVRMPTSQNDVIFVCYPKGQGAFEESEREHYLKMALSEVAWRLAAKENPHQVV